MYPHAQEVVLLCSRRNSSYFYISCASPFVLKISCFENGNRPLPAAAMRDHLFQSDDWKKKRTRRSVLQNVRGVPKQTFSNVASGVTRFVTHYVARLKERTGNTR